MRGGAANRGAQKSLDWESAVAAMGEESAVAHEISSSASGPAVASLGQARAFSRDLNFNLDIAAQRSIEPPDPELTRHHPFTSTTPTATTAPPQLQPRRNHVLRCLERPASGPPHRPHRPRNGPLVHLHPQHPQRASARPPDTRRFYPLAPADTGARHEGAGVGQEAL